MHTKPTRQLKARYGGYHAPILRAMSEKTIGMANKPPMNPMTQRTVTTVGRETFDVVVSIGDCDDVSIRVMPPTAVSATYKQPDFLSFN